MSNITTAVPRRYGRWNEKTPGSIGHWDRGAIASRGWWAVPTLRLCDRVLEGL
ncbi:MAG: hypothetical protein AB4352_20595 [Hormoscilla sp.]